MKKHVNIISLVLLAIIILFVIAPEVSIKACLAGINVWATSILPALFPFFFFTKILSELNVITKLSKSIAPLTRKIFNTPGISGYVYLMSILSGYPVGAKITSDFYENKIISADEAHRIVTFTSTSGPLFILGTVAIGMFAHKGMGYIILVSHFVGAILNGIFFRNYKLKSVTNNIQTSNVVSKNMLEECMLNSIKSILIVGGYVSIFFMLITMFNHFNIFLPFLLLLKSIFPLIDTGVVNAIFSGIIELTRGCLDLSLTSLTIKQSAPILSAIISFGGLSINLQSLTFLRKMNITLRFFFLQKTTHAIFSVLLCLISTFIFL